MNLWQGRNRRGDREKAEREKGGDMEERGAFRETQRLHVCLFNNFLFFLFILYKLYIE